MAQVVSMRGGRTPAKSLRQPPRRRSLKAPTQLPVRSTRQKKHRRDDLYRCFEDFRTAKQDALTAILPDQMSRVTVKTNRSGLGKKGGYFFPFLAFFADFLAFFAFFAMIRSPKKRG